jgi:hypothetical protein
MNSVSRRRSRTSLWFFYTKWQANRVARNGRKIMKLQLAFTMFLLVGTILQSVAETPVPQSSPEALVSDLYKQTNSPFFQTKDRGLVNKYFSERLSQLIWKDAVSSKGEVGALDFDPLYDAQDTDIKKFSLRKSKSGKDSAEVSVSFENMGQKIEMTYSLVLTKRGWKISNIKYADDRNLVDLLSGK